MVHLPVVEIVFNMCKDVVHMNTHRRLYKHCKTRESLLKFDSERKIPCHTGNQIGIGFGLALLSEVLPTELP